MFSCGIGRTQHSKLMSPYIPATQTRGALADTKGSLWRTPRRALISRKHIVRGYGAPRRAPTLPSLCLPRPDVDLGRCSLISILSFLCTFLSALESCASLQARGERGCSCGIKCVRVSLIFAGNLTGRRACGLEGLCLGGCIIRTTLLTVLQSGLFFSLPHVLRLHFILPTLWRL